MTKEVKLRASTVTEYIVCVVENGIARPAGKFADEKSAQEYARFLRAKLVVVHFESADPRKNPLAP